MSNKRNPHNGRPDGDDIILRTFHEYQLYVGDERSNQYLGPDDRMHFVFGRAGNDGFIGGAEGDDLIGGVGNDQLNGRAGPDHLKGESGNDRLVGGVEADTLMGGDGNDYLDEGDGHGDLEGGRGNDVLVGGRGADAFVIAPDSGNDIIKDFVAGPGMFDHLAIMDIQPEQLRFRDTHAGVRISWSTDQGSGSVLLEGVFKKDLAQDDFMFADNRHLIQPTSLTADHVDARHFAKNEGNETGPAAPDSSTSAQYQTSFDGNNVMFGRDFANDVFRATERNDFYFGLDGDDMLFGGAGDDHLAGGAGNDTLVGADGQGDLRGGIGNDRLYGGAMADNLVGEEGNDYLSAGAGHDMLEGGAGDDTYQGGDGADAFMVAHGSGNDVVIGGFDAGSGAFDHIAFMDVLPGEVTVTDDVASTHGDDHTGVLVSWGDGSIFLEGIEKIQLAQDDFMFSAVEGGGFVPDTEITLEGSRPLFQGVHPDWYLV